MKRHLTTVMILLLPVMALQAQVTIRGKVIDKDTREPVSGASITIPNTTIGTTTDNSGTFAISIAENRQAFA